MSDRINLLQRVTDMDVSPVFSEYTHVRILTDRKAKDEETGEEYDVVYEAAKPNDTGRLLELTCPWGSQTMAENILNRINPDSGVAFRYQPYSAKGAMLDPAAELGDGVTVKGVSGGVYSQTENFGVRHLSDIEAPTDEEIDHEYPYEPQKDRQTERKFAIERAERIAELAIQQDQIDAKVEAVYDNGATTTSQKFGWQLTADKFIVYGGSGPSNPVLKVTKDGLEVKGSGTFTGTVNATAGKIGSGTNANNYITIQNGYIYSKSHNSYDSTSSGFYIGPSGISFGNGSKVTFQVSSNGSLTANTGTFSGTVYAGKISFGNSNDDYVHGNAISSGTLSKGRTTQSVQQSLDNGDDALSGLVTLSGVYKISGGNAAMDYVDVKRQLTLYDPNAGRNRSVQIASNGVLYLYGYPGP